MQELHALAAMPTAYELLDELGAIKTLLSLLSHDNTDIAVAVIDLIQVSSFVSAEYNRFFSPTGAHVARRRQ